ncbi:P-loop NTPase [Streptomyces siamensis]|uniref:Novel STAND NTPase 5 domain-containing protein n=1 Tax=Streptomyces siamensis TaxID=1274986 RepID=A0ABP9JJP9_9ACTN
MATDGVMTGDQDDLITRLLSLLLKGDKPIAFVTGSGISVGAVEGVGGIVDAMRKMLDTPRSCDRFDQKVIGPSDGERYQQAARFLEYNVGQDALNSAIRAAVLRAYTGKSPTRNSLYRRNDPHELAAAEEQFDQWNLTRATEALGRLLRFVPAERRGPVITTNFDPLLEIAVRKAGAEANFQYFDLDGRLIRGDHRNNIDIAHVHGYWRRGDTLHTVAQLEKERSQLRGSLRESLRDHTVVVIGYSGWDDAFSRSLRDRVQEQEMTGIDLIWCSYAKLTEADFASGLFKELNSAPRTYFYDGIDANEMLPALLDEYLQVAPQPDLDGWLQVTPAFLEKEARRKHDAGQVVGFFDGAEPDWRTALDVRVPRLSLVGALTGRVHRCLNGGLAKRIVAAVAPMGEGKSIALRQATVDLVRARDDITVYWRKPGAALDLNALLAVPHRPGHHILLVSDDGALVVDDLQRLIVACEAHGRTDIHVLLTAQEREWRDRGATGRLRGSLETVPSLGLTEKDGQDLVTAWEEADALGELAGTPEDERADRLVQLAAASYGRRDSALVGAMLQLRYGPMLREHVGAMLQRLEAYSPVGNGTLRECFLMIALLHTAYDPEKDQAAPLSQRVLAQAMGLQPAVAVEWEVTNPLGMEAAVSGYGRELWVRHRSIADAALDISQKQDPGELPALAQRLTTAAVEIHKQTGDFDKDLHAAAYLSLGLVGPNERRFPLESVTAAEAAVAASPWRLSFRTAQIIALRRADRIDDARRFAERTGRELSSMTDGEPEVNFFTAWGTVTGLAGEYASNILLCGIALPSSVQQEDVNVSLLSMGVGLTELHSQSSDAVFLDALRGVVGLMSERQLNRRNLSHLQRHRGYLARFRATELEGADAWAAVQAAVDALTPTADPSLAPVLARAGRSILPLKELR